MKQEEKEWKKFDFLFFLFLKKEEVRSGELESTATCPLFAILL